VTIKNPANQLLPVCTAIGIALAHVESHNHSGFFGTRSPCSGHRRTLIWCAFPQYGQLFAATCGNRFGTTKAFTPKATVFAITHPQPQNPTVGRV
jgi:hypothetical protein